MRMTSLASSLVLLATWVVVGSVGAATARQSETASTPTPKTKVVATIGMIADVAREVGGDRIDVTALMGEGVDPHLYKPSPGDVRIMADADMILFNGLHLEGRMADVIVKLAARCQVVQVTDAIDESALREPPEFQGHADPHVWFNVELWRNVAGRIRGALVEKLVQKDPAGAEAISKRHDGYAHVLGELHQYVKDIVATIPKERRVMVTAHDAFGYFGAAYGIDVMAIQGISTDSEASLQDINALVDTLVKRRVPAVFIESSVPRKTIDALIEGCNGRGHTVTVGGELFSDAMGRAGTLEGTYVGMVLHNVDTIAKALGGTVPEKRSGRLAEYTERWSTHAPVPTPASPRPSSGA